MTRRKGPDGPSGQATDRLIAAGKQAAVDGVPYGSCPETNLFHRSAWLTGHEVATRQMQAEEVQARIDALDPEDCRRFAKLLAANSFRRPQYLLTMLDRATEGQEG